MKKFENTEIIEKESTYTVKDIEITFMEKNRVDKETGKIIYDPTLEQENDIVLYNIYNYVFNNIFTSSRRWFWRFYANDFDYGCYVCFVSLASNEKAEQRQEIF